jgi:hypothetical protein
MMTKASIQECLVSKHLNVNILVVMMIVTMTRNLPRHQRQCNGKFQLMTLMDNGEKFTCQHVCEQRAKRLHNRRKKAALRKERIKSTPFAKDADNPFVPFIVTSINDKEPTTTVDNEVEFFPTDTHPIRTGTIIEENGFIFKKWMDSFSTTH